MPTGVPFLSRVFKGNVCCQIQSPSNTFGTCERFLLILFIQFNTARWDVSVKSEVMPIFSARVINLVMVGILLIVIALTFRARFLGWISLRWDSLAVRCILDEQERAFGRRFSFG